MCIFVQICNSLALFEPWPWMSIAKKLVSNPSEPWDNGATAAQQQTMQRAPVPHCSLQNTAAHWLQAVVMSSHGITVPILPSSLLNTSSNITTSVHFRLWLVTHEMRIQFHPLAFGTSDPEYSSSFRGAYLKCEKFMSFIYNRVSKISECLWTWQSI